MLCVVSHDAGGAEVLASYIARNGIECLFVLQGPARKVFERRLGKIVTVELEAALDLCDEFLCGTSWQSDLEWRAIAAARAAGKISRVFLDHWGHFQERFVRSGIQHLPDELWVGDVDAEILANKFFPHTKVRLISNPYFEDIRDDVIRLESRLNPRNSTEALQVLFVCEPLSEHGLKEFGDPRHWGYTEFEALRYFFANLHVLSGKVAKIVIRPHPSEQPGKYDEIAEEFSPLTSVGGGKPLLEEVAACDVVVGCESMAMVVGLIAGRRVIATIPPGGRACSLPQTDIESLQHLVNQSHSKA